MDYSSENGKTLERGNTRETFRKIWQNNIKISVKLEFKPKLNVTRMILNLEKNY